jgi:hypothetical protein
MGQPELKTAGRVRELEARIRQLSEENAKLLEQWACPDSPPPVAGFHLPPRRPPLRVRPAI